VEAGSNQRQQSLFRKAALAKMQSPERLDTLLPVTSPVGWLLLLTIGFVLLVTVVWGYTGTIIRTTTGEGILVRNADMGIMSIGGQGSGAIEEVLIQVGDEVKKGTPIFKLDLAQTHEQLVRSRDALAALMKQEEAQRSEEADRLKILQEKLANQESLYERGLLTKSPVLDTKTAIYELESRQYARTQQILDQNARIADLEIRLKQEGIVRSPFDGEVLEVAVNLGDYAQPGRLLARFQSLEGNEDALVFVPAGDGKKVKPGMRIRISPSTVKPEEFGYIQGTVRSVSMYPISKDEMMTELGNEITVERILRGGEVIALIATLETDPKSPSGFKWSSATGPDISVEGGTLCTASIVLERERPITLVLPFLKKLLGLY
jgi:HlyD family secretion protein